MIKKNRTILACSILLIAIYGCSSRHTPQGTDIIEEKIGSCDLQGDYSYCVKFRINDNEKKELLDKGFKWFPRYIKKKQKPQVWKDGIVPEDIQDLINGIDIKLKSAPDFSIKYKYLYQWEDGGFWRFIAIDEKEKVVYYYRVTW